MTKNLGCVDDRFKQHLRYLRGGYHHNSKLQEDYDSHKDETLYIHELLASVSTKEEASKLEQEYIIKFNSKEDGFNLNDGGTSNKGYKQSDHAKAVASEVHSKKIGELNSFYGKKHSDETKKKLSEANKGRLKGIPKSASQIEKMKDNHARSKQVNFYGAVYRSYTEAERQTGINRKKIASMAKNEEIPQVFLLAKTEID